MKTTTYIFTVIFLLMVNASAMAASTRIIGGTEVTRADQNSNYPWISTLFISEFFSCGATLIAPEWVLTAAHCVLDENTGEVLAADDFTVAVGDYNRVSAFDHEFRVVTEVYVAAGYDTITTDNDIAILKLSEPALATPITLIDTNAFNALADGTNLTVMGWGNTVEDENEEGIYPNFLREVDVALANFQDCADDYAATGQPVSTNMFCAGGNGLTDSCQGDSGGPIIRLVEGEYQQVGIVSWGGIEFQGCAAEGYPGIYTRLSKYTPWIESVLAGNEIQDFVPEDETPVENPHTGSSRKKPSVGSMGFALLLLFPILFRGRKIKYGRR